MRQILKFQKCAGRCCFCHSKEVPSANLDVWELIRKKCTSSRPVRDRQREGDSPFPLENLDEMVAGGDGIRWVGDTD